MRKVLKKILLIFFVLIVAIQVPFIYRRWQIGKVAEIIASSNIGRTRTDPKFTEYKGIIHAHTSLGGHSSAGFDELISAANQNALDFVITTEHWSDAFDTSALTLNGLYGNTLFVGGNEIDTSDSDRLLMIPGSGEAASLRKISTTNVIDKLHAENRQAFVTYPERFKSWDAGFDGIEVFNVHTAAKNINIFTGVFDLIWLYPRYPKLTLASYFRRPDSNLAKFDDVASKREVSLIAGTDAHSNIGLFFLGDETGKKFGGVKIDPYVETLGIVRLHVLLEKDRPLDRASLIDAVKSRRFFVGLDALGSTAGFEFAGTNGANTVEMGERIESGSGDFALTAISPLKAKFIAFRNGEKLAEEANVSEFEIRTKGPGAYRIEVFREDLGAPFDKIPWIISNPIFVR